MDWLFQQPPAVVAAIAFVAGGVFNALVDLVGREVSANRDHGRRTEMERAARLRELALLRIRETRAYFDAYQDHLVERLMEPAGTEIAPFSASRWPHRSFEYVSFEHLRSWHTMIGRYVRRAPGSGLKPSEFHDVLSPHHLIEEDLNRAEDLVTAGQPVPLLTSSQLREVQFDAFRELGEEMGPHPHHGWPPDAD